MTDRHCGYVVILADDVREDDAEHLVNALRMVKGVADVQPVNPSDARPAAFILENRVRNEIRDKLYEVLRQI